MSSVDLSLVSREDLERQYQFQMHCLGILVNRAGGKVLITDADIEPNARLERLWYSIGVNGDIEIELRRHKPLSEDGE